MKSDLQAAQSALTRYFDNSSKQTQTVLDLVKQVDAGSAAVDNVAVNTEEVEVATMVRPAPANSVDIDLSPDGRTLYEAVGRPSSGNLQALPVRG